MADRLGIEIATEVDIEDKDYNEEKALEEIKTTARSKLS